MKADSCGTWTEQLRHKMGWKAPRQVSNAGNAEAVVCARCKHSTFKSLSSRSCLHLDGGFATPPGATCDNAELYIFTPGVKR